MSLLDDINTPCFYEDELRNQLFCSDSEINSDEDHDDGVLSPIITDPRDIRERLREAEGSREGSPIKSNGKGKKKKSGTKAIWPQSVVTDMIDIILDTPEIKKRLFTSISSNKRNKEVFQQVINILEERCAANGTSFMFNVEQTRRKFRNCISKAKSFMLTSQKGSGLTRFMEDNELGPWFARLCQELKSRPTCRRSEQIEPSSKKRKVLDSESLSSKKDSDETPPTSSSSASARGFVPDHETCKKSTKSKNKEKNDVLQEISNTMKNLNDALSATKPLDDLVSLMKEECKRQAAVDQQLISLMALSMGVQLPLIPPVNNDNVVEDNGNGNDNGNDFILNLFE